MMLLRLLKINILIGSTIMILMMMMSPIVNGKPQSQKKFKDLDIESLVMAGDMPVMVDNADMSSTNAAFKNDYDSSLKDIRSRKKRSLPLPYEESLDIFKHLHRNKRSPCFFGMGGTGGTGGNGGDGGAGADAERRRRANAQKMAARKKAANAKAAKNKSTTPATKDLDNNDAEEISIRRKRQTELDDLNQNMINASKDFQQQTQQISEQIRNFFQGFMNSMNDMAEKFKQHFGAQTSTNTEEI